MILPASYANGFAPRDGQPLYPELWRGCVGAWAPCLGPTGLTLRDWSGYGNNGTLTNMDAGTDWVSRGGRYALDFDGTNDAVITNSVSFGFTGAQFVSLWFNAASITVANSPTIFNYQQSSGSFLAQISIGFNIVSLGPTLGTSQLSVIDYNGTGTSGAFTSTTFGSRLNEWIHVCGGWDGARWFIFVNGVDETNANGTQDAPTLVNGVPVRLGNSVVSRPFSGQIDDVMWSRRQILPSEIRLLASRRGIAYELAPRRRSRVSVLASLRYNIFTGNVGSLEVIGAS